MRQNFAAPGSVPAGTTISVYISDGHTLLMNTGNAPFALGPAYISYNHSGDGATTYDT
jgi:hypothetical protein